MPDGTSFKGSNLTGVNLEGLIAPRSKWTGACLDGANLKNAGLQQALFSSSSKYPAASIVGTNFSGAILRNTDLRGVKLNQETMVDADLEGALIEEDRKPPSPRRTLLPDLVGEDSSLPPPSTPLPSYTIPSMPSSVPPPPTPSARNRF